MAKRVTCNVCNKEFKNEEALEHHMSSKHPKPKTEEKKSSGSKWWIIGIAAVVLIAIIIFFSMGGSADGQYDTFAQCVSDSGAKMFGAYWCPHCAEQKEMFGDSFDYVNYVECSLPNRAGQTQECNNEGIQSYPTWEFGDGSRQTGVIPLQQLSQITGCPFVADAE